MGCYPNHFGSPPLPSTFWSWLPMPSYMGGGQLLGLMGSMWPNGKCHEPIYIVVDYHCHTILVDRTMGAFRVSLHRMVSWQLMPHSLLFHHRCGWLSAHCGVGYWALPCAHMQVAIVPHREKLVNAMSHGWVAHRKVCGIVFQLGNFYSTKNERGINPKSYLSKIGHVSKIWTF